MGKGKEVSLLISYSSVPSEILMSHVQHLFFTKHFLRKKPVNECKKHRYKDNHYNVLMTGGKTG